jgi:Ca2+-binding EF-hand superfamily protein
MMFCVPLTNDKFLYVQIVSRNMTNLTPAQLEEFESTFRYFDKDTTNTLNLAEMIAALASLGIVYSEEDMDLIYDQLVSEYGAVTFEAFINLLVREPLIQNFFSPSNRVIHIL